MTIFADVSDFDNYFNRLLPSFVYENITAELLFTSGVRPAELLNMGTGNIDLSNSTINFNQVKSGSFTSRTVNIVVLEACLSIWRTHGNPGTYFGSYSSLRNYLNRSISFKGSINNRLSALYPFRYSCAGDLLHKDYTRSEIYDFFQHSNTANTDRYIDQGALINKALKLN